MLGLKRTQSSSPSNFGVYTRVPIVCTRGRYTSYCAAVTLSPSKTVEVGISARRPQHILCLKTDTKLTSSHSLSQVLWPTFNGKTQRFVVGYWKLSLWYVIVNNCCSKSFLSLTFCYSHPLLFLLPLKGGVSDLTHWCIFRHRRQEDCELSFL